MNVKSIINWTLYVIVLVVVTVIGIWLWNELSPRQNGPLADVSLKAGGGAQHVKILLIDEEQNPISSSLITIVTEKGEHDVSTNNQGSAERNCEGNVVTALRVERLLVFSKSLAEITGTPSLAKGLEFRIIAKRPDILGPQLPPPSEEKSEHSTP